MRTPTSPQVGDTISINGTPATVTYVGNATFHVKEFPACAFKKHTGTCNTCENHVTPAEDTTTRQCPTCPATLDYQAGIGHRRDALLGRYYVGGWFCQVCESGWCEDEEHSRDSAACECVAGFWCDVCTHDQKESFIPCQN